MRDRVLRLCLRAYPEASRERDGRAILDLASELSSRGSLAFLREASGVVTGGIRARAHALLLRLGGSPHERRDGFFGIAAVFMALGYLLSAWSTASIIAGNGFGSGSGLVDAGTIILILSVLVQGAAFAVFAAAFLGAPKVRDARLRRGAFVLAGAYGLGILNALLYAAYSLSSPEVGLPQTLTILMWVADLPALVAVSLAASAFAPAGDKPGATATDRNRRLGWAGAAMGVQFALYLPRYLGGAPGWTWGATYLAAFAAVVIATAGFFAAARAHRLGLPEAQARRDSALAVAAIMYLVYRTLELTHVAISVFWLYGLASGALTLAALSAVAGLIASRRTVDNHGHRTVLAGDR